MNKLLLAVQLILVSSCLGQTIDLSGPAWTFKSATDDYSQSVTVPDTWPMRKGYQKYIGTAIYERDFDFAGVPAGKSARLCFDAVYAESSIWLNGRRLGNHFGGYTPFEFDVTHALKTGTNHLLVEVSNVPSLSSIPAVSVSSGSTNYPPYGTAGRRSGIVGWMPYGGIVRPVRLQISDDLYVRRTRVRSKVDLHSGVASLQISAWVHNSGPRAREAIVETIISGQHFKLRSKTSVPPNGDAELIGSGELRNAHLWSVRDPFLYEAVFRTANDQVSTKFGVRDVRVRGSQLLLNGKPVHLFGANRVSEDAEEGLLESREIVSRDMTDMLGANMRMMRIAHYPQVSSLLDFADEHGMLLTGEVGNWNWSAWQMADPQLRRLWKAEMKEMVEDEWNHPSLIAWSVGNEYESQTLDGIEWTRDMRKYTLDLDPTRLITFASKMMMDPAVRKGTDEGSRYSDFVSVNCYGDYGAMLDRAHELYPDKPVFMTEFGKTGEPGVHDPERIENIRNAVAAMKARPWVIGGALWAWNDYRSLHRGTPSSGIRYWGVVNIQREHRDSWNVVRDLFAVELP